MAIDRVNAVLIGRVRDSEGFPCDLLEDPLTGAQSLAYEPEVFWQKGELAKLRASRPRRDSRSGPGHCAVPRPASSSG